MKTFLIISIALNIILAIVANNKANKLKRLQKKHQEAADENKAIIARRDGIIAEYQAKIVKNEPVKVQESPIDSGFHYSGFDRGF